MQTLLYLIHKGNLDGVNLIEAESAVMISEARERRNVQHYCLIPQIYSGVLGHSRVTIINNNNISISK